MIRATPKGSYKCFLQPHTMLPMVHVDDCIDGMIQLMSVSRDRLTRSVYNIQSMSFNPEMLKGAIEEITNKPLSVTFEADHRQAIADSWPHRLDDTNARSDWGWSPRHDLHSTIKSILKEIVTETQTATQAAESSGRT